MSIDLNPLDFPLHGSRLIEASAGTGKTWTIAALYVRLVLGHGGANAFSRALQPVEILVMTFTRAATRELSDRIRQRLLQTAQCFRGTLPGSDIDPFLRSLLAEYGSDPAVLNQAAHRLAMAAEAMDDAAVFTIDAWGQRMLREHAFDSGSLFDEELIENDTSLYRDTVRDYWRSEVYALNEADFAEVSANWAHLHAMEQSGLRNLVKRTHYLPAQTELQTLAAAIRQARKTRQQLADVLKATWKNRAPALQAWFAAHRAQINGNTYREKTVDAFFGALNAWLDDPLQTTPSKGFDAAADKWDIDKLIKAAKGGAVYTPPDDFARVADLKNQLDALPAMLGFLLTHAAPAIEQRMAKTKTARHQFAFADLLARLKHGLQGANGAALRARIVAQYPVALIDEFQDTSPDQYQIFDSLYQVEKNQNNTGLFLIGDPKQAIYGFRGADINSYLAARAATAGRHYRLRTNFRSTTAAVTAVNHLFLHAEDNAAEAGQPRGAFGYRSADGNPLPFHAVQAAGRAERLCQNGHDVPAMTICINHSDEALNATDFKKKFAGHCAEAIVRLLNDATVEFISADGAQRLRPADIAVLVRDRHEAAAIQTALRRRRVASVYLSDKDSVFKSPEAADVWRWLVAIASPLDARLGRVAFATVTAALPLTLLQAFSTDELLWESRIEQLKRLQKVWQRQGVLAALRQFIHELNLLAPAAVEDGGERRLTNLLHLAELLQNESRKLDGEHALIRWLGEQIEDVDSDGSEHTLRLESDAQLVQVITVFKAKGLEYPVVFLPFAVAARPFSSSKKDYVEVTNMVSGGRTIDFAMSPAVIATLDTARLQEDLRLLYVALTRARHALWLGVASVKDAIGDSALGYLLKADKPMDDARVAALIQAASADCEAIVLLRADTAASETLFVTRDSQVALEPALHYASEFERRWSITSYTALTKGMQTLAAPSTAAEEQLDGEGADPRASNDKTASASDQPWHRFPRGAIPGQFLHTQLEWMAASGFASVDDAGFADRLAARCSREGWGHRSDDTVTWLSAVARTLLHPVGTSLAGLTQYQSEMEFWLPASTLQVDQIDRLCQRALPAGLAVPALSTREIAGMLRGFQDLVFAHEERYWVLDYKSNALGACDADYHPAALAAAVAQHRYDVQGMIYLLALHRLLRNRLGTEYDPAVHLGGAVFFFLRGCGNASTSGCYVLQPDLSLLDEFDRLLSDPIAAASNAALGMAHVA